jgi:hypothetical protein
MPNLAPIADRLGKLMRLLASNRDGEVVAAVRGLMRTLTAAGADIHALANLVERGAVKSTTANPDAVDWHAIAIECLEASWVFSERERDFVEGMVDLTKIGGEPSERQAVWLRKIYARRRRWIGNLCDENPNLSACD